ncbi:MAG TPA: redox-sensing transcriptional repressor Rex [Clostridiales bacterium UBA8153]|nr:redox-sensing transcriptional repressor Rex [Clostridiales bacterium UBA8153]
MPKVSAAVLSRLPHYYQILTDLRGRGREFVSSEHLGRLLGIDDSLVRKDLTGVVSGVQRVGYHVPTTLARIEEILGLANIKDACLAGVGSLGRALLRYPGFEQYGMKIVAAFDNDPAVVGSQVAGIPVLGLSELEYMIARLKIRIGIIAVPAPAAQGVADGMLRSGIMAIWNFAPVALVAPPEIIVRHENLAAGLSLISYELQEKMRLGPSGDTPEPGTSGESEGD